MWLAWTYLCASYRKRSANAVRTLVLATLVTAGVFFFAAVLPAVSFKQTGALQAAKWNLIASSPGARGIPDSTRAALSGGDKRLIVGHTVTGDASTQGGEPVSTGILVLQPSASRDLSWYSPDLVVDGSFNTDGIWMDVITSRQLGARLGDRVTVRFTSLVNGQPQVTEISKPFTALFAPTLQTTGICLMTELPSGTDLAMDVFASIPAAQAEETASRLRRTSEQDGWNVSTISEEWTAGRRRVDEAINRNTRFSLIWISIAIYVGYAWREMAGRFRVRRHDFAVLLSIGAPIRDLLGIAICEQLIFGTLSAVAGFAIGAWALVRLSHLWVPADTYMFLAGYVALANLAVLVVTTMGFSRRIRSLPVAQLLSEE
ncbi:MAG: hypothetical protein FD171_191 [Actinobacteria bacterium]|nr:MAG: hypothetical protein FD171_191 [Actinomycetota bacterium]MDO8949490.1 hypothetical protein [Actinomycetota bacterium]